VELDFIFDLTIKWTIEQAIEVVSNLGQSFILNLKKVKKESNFYHFKLTMGQPKALVPFLS
jgi:hypothetical protein